LTDHHEIWNIDSHWPCEAYHWKNSSY